MLKCSFFAAVLFFLAAGSTAQTPAGKSGPIISEFMASNESSLIDEDGETSDWIEIFNWGDSPTNLSGWSLTDQSTFAKRWVFPSVVLQPNRFLIVFASGKNRRDPSKNLHTNFQLNSDGAELLLFKPNGSVQNGFVYGREFPDVSYGAAMTKVGLVTTNQSVKYKLLEEEESLAGDWASVGFSDSTWTVAPLGIGFDIKNQGVTYPDAIKLDEPVHYWRFEESATSTPAVDQGLLGGNDGTYTGGVQLQQPGAYAGMGKSMKLDGAEGGTYVSVGNFHPGAQATFEVWAKLAGTAVKDYHALLTRWDGSYELDVNSAPSAVNGTTPRPGNAVFRDKNQAFYQLATPPIPRDQWFHMVAVYGDGYIALYQDGVEVHRLAVAAGLADAGPSRVLIGATREPPAFNWTGWIDEVAVYNKALTAEQIQQHYQAALGNFSGGGLRPFIKTDIAPLMHQKTSAAFIRIPFTVPAGSSFEALNLKVRYDSGFVAYLNGVEIARKNAPAGNTFSRQTTSMLERNAEASMAETINLYNVRGLLVSGDNVISFAALNSSPNDDDFLLQAEMTGWVVPHKNGKLISRYFVGPSPAEPNGWHPDDQGPAIPEGSSINYVQSNYPVVIQAKVENISQPLQFVRAQFRVMYNAEQPVPLKDDGVAPDLVSGDGIFTGKIEPGSYKTGEMIRYKIEAAEGGHNSRWPLFYDRFASDEYEGTVVGDPSRRSAVKVFNWFVENPAQAATPSGTRASVYFESEFYDNIFVRIRGASAPFFPKPPYKFDFNKGRHFNFQTGMKRVEEINLNGTHQDKAKIRAVLAMETYNQMGTPAPAALPVRAQQNGTFHSVAVMVEQIDDRFLERHGFDTDGAMYKIYSGLNSPGAFEKTSRKWDNNSDYQELIQNLALNNPNRAAFFFDQFDVPAIINYLAAGAIIQDFDRTVKNYYIYRDTDGNALWRIFPWDKDLTFGLRALQSDYVSGNDDTPIEGILNHLTGLAGAISHPLFGMEGRHCCGVNNLMDLVYETPVTREMYLRRLRTLMDAFLQPPMTPEPLFEKRLDYFQSVLGPDAMEDNAKWIQFGVPQDLQTAIRILKINYLDQRRVHLFQTHANPPDNAGVIAGIPTAQPSRPYLEFGLVEHSPNSGKIRHQFIELVNTNAFAVDISSWRIEGGVEYRFDPGTVVPAGGKIYIAGSIREFATRTTGPKRGQGLLVVGGFEGTISKAGDTLALKAPDGFTVATKSFTGTPSLLQQFLRITEIMFRPVAAPGGSEFQTGDFQFLKLENTGANCLDISGVRMTDGIGFTFPPDTKLLPGEAVVITENVNAFVSRYGHSGMKFTGDFALNLARSGETLKLEDPNSGVVQLFTYANSWYPQPPGEGHSLQIIDPSQPAALWNQSEGWKLSSKPGGNPGSLPRTWSHFHFPNAEPSGWEDPDQDGADNRTEFEAGTLPKDPNSNPYLNIVANNTAVTISFPTVAIEEAAANQWRRVYVVESTESLGSPWLNTANPIDGDGSVKTLTFPLGSKRFYRLKIELMCK